ncbi:NAD(P)H-quinone oxidoreductase [Mucilaginibacter sp. Bleaf8]|uniref:NAD(P)H-quinone oxidoreductase n=1 Tax=Mucilaginibacter sp. Bleaf8 TaxID=2834430 RepID=UPI001BCE216D|nr:NAD(P)H-quinone oxidoreductase [Mucilaginibacter sp. Bleaf8]MBS7566273.1 NAD(P)H-quinone oxidoreductase [Mucilaginibacter sp. Bleaf8]
MNAIIISQPGAPNVLQLTERPQPTPKQNEVLIKVAAAGINRPDVAQRKGVYPPPPDAPQDIPGLEVAGTITAVGTAVTQWQTGDQVCALVSGGGYAEYCTAPEGQCLPVPGNLSMAEAASLPETFFTVWSNVFNRGQLQPGETLLVHGGSSGIGVTAIQVAAALGSKVYVTAGSDDKCQFCEQLGAAKAINYKTQNFADEMKHLTNGKGVNVILDMIGGDYTTGNLESLAEDGRLVMINTMNGKDAEVDLSVVMRKRLTITGSTLRPRNTAFKSAIAKSLQQHIWPLIESGKIKPVIHEIFAADQAAKAHELMESSTHIGKIVLQFSV